MTTLKDYNTQRQITGILPYHPSQQAPTPANKFAVGPVLAGDPGFPLRMTTLKVSGRMTIFEYQRQTLLNGEDPA
jgi:hypothetical protein